MEYPPWGACQLLGQEAPLCEGAPSRCVGGGGRGEREKQLDSPGVSQASPSLVRLGDRAPPSEP